MILFTKEIFLQLKAITNLHVNVSISQYHDDGKPVYHETWQIYIQGLVEYTSQHSDVFQTYITAASKEDAYRIYKELAEQIVNSGAIPELNTKLIDDVLKEN